VRWCAASAGGDKRSEQLRPAHRGRGVPADPRPLGEFFRPDSHRSPRTPPGATRRTLFTYRMTNVRRVRDARH
jgi:hypothetical protein